MNPVKWIGNKVLNSGETMGLSATKAHADQLLRVSFSLLAIAMMSFAAIVTYYIFSPFAKFLISIIIDIKIAWLTFGCSIVFSWLAHRSSIRFYNAYDRQRKEHVDE